MKLGRRSNKYVRLFGAPKSFCTGYLASKPRWQCSHLIGQETKPHGQLLIWLGMFGILWDATAKHPFQIPSNQNSKKLILQSVKSRFSYTSLIHPHTIFHLAMPLGATGFPWHKYGELCPTRGVVQVVWRPMR